MLPTRTAKPLVSSLLAIAFVLALVMPFLSIDYLKGPTTPFDVVQAGAIHYGVILGIALLWLGVQLFWEAPTEATKLGMAASATIVWLALAFFFNFRANDPATEGQRGAAAFFALMGGLGVVLLWTRFLSDEISA